MKRKKKKKKKKKKKREKKGKGKGKGKGEASEPETIEHASTTAHAFLEGEGASSVTAASVAVAATDVSRALRLLRVPAGHLRSRPSCPSKFGATCTARRVCVCVSMCVCVCVLETQTSAHTHTQNTFDPSLDLSFDLSVQQEIPTSLQRLCCAGEDVSCQGTWRSWCKSQAQLCNKQRASAMRCQA